MLICGSVETKFPGNETAFWILGNSFFVGIQPDCDTYHYRIELIRCYGNDGFPLTLDREIAIFFFLRGRKRRFPLVTIRLYLFGIYSTSNSLWQLLLGHLNFHYKEKSLKVTSR